MHRTLPPSRALLATPAAAIALGPALLTAQPRPENKRGAQAGPFGVLSWRSLGPALDAVTVTPLKTDRK